MRESCSRNNVVEPVGKTSLVLDTVFGHELEKEYTELVTSDIAYHTTWACIWWHQTSLITLLERVSGDIRRHWSHYLSVYLVTSDIAYHTTWACIWWHQTSLITLLERVSGDIRHHWSHYLSVYLVTSDITDHTTWACIWWHQTSLITLPERVSGDIRHSVPHYLSVYLVTSDIIDHTTWACICGVRQSNFTVPNWMYILHVRFLILLGNEQVLPIRQLPPVFFFSLTSSILPLSVSGQYLLSSFRAWKHKSIFKLICDSFNWLIPAPDDIMCLAVFSCLLWNFWRSSCAFNLFT